MIMVKESLNSKPLLQLINSNFRSQYGVSLTWITRLVLGAATEALPVHLRIIRSFFCWGGGIIRIHGSYYTVSSELYSSLRLHPYFGVVICSSVIPLVSVLTSHKGPGKVSH